MKRNLGRKRFIWLSVYSSSKRKIRAEAQGMNLEAETNTQGTQGQCSLTSQSVVLYTLGLPAQRWHHQRRSLPSHITNSSNTNIYTNLPSGHSDVDIFLIVFFSFKVTLLFVKVPKLTGKYSTATQ